MSGVVKRYFDYIHLKFGEVPLSPLRNFPSCYASVAVAYAVMTCGVSLSCQRPLS